MSELVEYWTDVVLRASPLVIAVFAGVVAWRSYLQKRDADRRSAWWERVRWTLDLLTSADDAESTLGWALLPEAMEDAGPDDEKLAQAVWNYVDTQLVNQIELESDQDHGDEDDTDPREQ